jgi:hypothetical protein
VISVVNFEWGFISLPAIFYTTHDGRNTSLDDLTTVAGKGSKRGVYGQYRPQLTTLLLIIALHSLGEPLWQGLGSFLDSYTKKALLRNYSDFFGFFISYHSRRASSAVLEFCYSSLNEYF